MRMMSMRMAIRWISLLLVLFSVVVFNPFWPIWGNAYTRYYEDGNFLRITSAPLKSFLQNEQYSALNHFSAIFGLACLYLGLLLLITGIVIHYAMKKEILFVSLFSSALLLVSSIFLPFSCDYRELPFVYYCIIPFVCAVGIFISDIAFIKMKQKAVKTPASK